MLLGDVKQAAEVGCGVAVCYDVVKLLKNLVVVRVILKGDICGDVNPNWFGC